jgi:ATP-binding cassette, subfamily C, bacterial LapB
MAESYEAAGEAAPSGAAPSDALLQCLRVIARHYERPASPTVLTAGLPLERGGMTIDLFIRAAARSGLTARTADRRLRDLIPVELPAVIYIDDATPVVLLSCSADGDCRVHDSASGGTVTIPYDDLQRRYAGFCILIKAEFTASERGETGERGSSRHWFWSAASHYWRNYTRVIIASALINVLALATPLFILNVYDRVLPNEAIATLWVLAIGVMLAIGFDFGLRVARALIIDHVGRRIDMRVSAALFDRILNAGLAHRPATTGAFASRVSEYEFVREFFTSSTVTLAIDIFFTFIFLIVIYVLAGWVVVVPIVAILAVVVVGLVVQQLIGGRMKAAQEQAALRHSVLVESVSSIETVKSVRGEGYLQRKWEKLVAAGSDTQEKIRRLSTFGSSFAMFAQQMTTVGIVIGGMYRFTDGDMSMGAIIATVILANRAMAPLGQLAMMITRARHAVNAMEVLDGIMALPDERDAVTHWVARDIERGEIEFRNVEFAYPQSPRKSLDGASFRIRPGERVGIIGRIGSGKTTIGRLMSGLYPPSGGDVLIDGIDIRQYHPSEVRSAVALVVQDADLFYGSVKENILVAKPDADDAELVRAARLSGVEELVATHPMGFELPVGEKGSNLSGGQRQMVALARTLIAPFKVLFLDEPSSAMDMASERQLIARLNEAIPEDRTLIVCTHRHSMLALVNRLLVVDGGRIVADGPKDEVLKALTRQAQQQGGTADREAGKGGSGGSEAPASRGRQSAVVRIAAKPGGVRSSADDQSGRGGE